MRVSKDLMGLILLIIFTAFVKSSDLLFRQRTEVGKVMAVKRTG